MKALLPIAAILIFLSSCSSTFYYGSLNTQDEYVEKVENGDFLLETDSLWIAYCFKGANAPMQITIFNKLDEPLYIDWQKSVLIIDDMAYSYSGNIMPVTGSISTDTYSNETNTYRYSFGTFNGNIHMSDNTTFIPPQTMISEIPMSLDPSLFGLPKDLYKDAHMGNKYGELKKVKRANFLPSDSPMHFQSYLTIYAKPENPIVFRQNFYLSSLIKTGVHPNSLAGDMIERGDLFFIEKPADNNALYTTLGVIAVGGILTLGVIYGDDTYINE